MSGLTSKYFIARFFKNGRLHTCIDFTPVRYLIVLNNNYNDFRDSKEHRAGRIEIAAVQGKEEIVICDFKTDRLEEVEAMLFQLKSSIVKTVPRLG